MQVSLRLIAVVLSVTYAVLVAAFTLGVSVTITTRALQSFGKTHANALATVTLDQIEDLLERQSVQADAKKNASRIYAGPTPAYSAFQRQRWLDHCTLELFTLPAGRGPNVFFFDGSRAYATIFGFNTNPKADRFADNVKFNIEYYTVPFNYSSSWVFENTFYNDRLERMPLSDPIYNAARYRINYAASMNVIIAATFNGRQTLWAGQPLVLVGGVVVLTYNGIVAPLHDRSGTFVGFTGGVVIMDTFNVFLTQIQETPHSYGFIVDGLGFLLATSCPIPFQNTTVVPLGVSVPTGCAVSGIDSLANQNVVASSSQYMNCRTAAVDYGYAPLRAVMRDTELATATTQTAAYMVVDGDGYFVVSSPVAVRYPNLVLQLVITVPEVEVVGDLVGPRNVAIGVSVGVAAALSMGIAALVSFLFAPISAMATRLEDDDPLAGEEGAPLHGSTASSLSEVRDVQLAHRAMRAELRRIRAFVPLQATNPLDRITPDEYSLDSPRGAYVDLKQSVYPLPLATNPLHPTVSSLADGDMPEAESSTLGSAAADDSPGVCTRNRKVRRKVRFVDEDGASTVRYNVIEVPMLAVPKVSVLFANVNGFRRWCSQLPGALCRDTAAALTLGVRALVRDAHDAIQRHGGVLDRFNGDQVEATFAAHGGGKEASYTRAVLAGIDLIENRRSDAAATAAAMDDGLDGAAPLRWRVGVGFGSSIVGHAGSDAAQSSHIIGAAWTHAVACQELSKVYRMRGVVVSERVFALMRGEPGLEWRVLGLELLPGQKTTSVVLAVRSRGSASDEFWDRAILIRNAMHFVQSNDDATKATEAKLVDHLRERRITLDQWERQEFLRWTDIPAFTRLEASDENVSGLLSDFFALHNFTARPRQRC